MSAQDTGKTSPVPGLLDPIDEQEIISPGEIVGGDSITLLSSLAVKDHIVELSGNGVGGVALDIIGLVQGISIASSRAMRQIYQVGQTDPIIISSVGPKTLNMSSIISEETNLIRALYSQMIEKAQALQAREFITEAQYEILKKYNNLEIPEGLPRDLMRIPFGLILMFMSGDGELIEAIHLGHCLLASDSNTVEAGTRGVNEANAIMWQKTSYVTSYLEGV